MIMWIIRPTAVIMFFIIRTTAAETATEAPLAFLANYRYGNVYRYQAKCSLPCSGSYSPGTFRVTIALDKICSNFQAFGNFKPAQNTSSSVWYLNNTNWISSNSEGNCQFDVQFDHSPQNPVPTGTCKLGWETPTDCLMPDQTGTVLYGWMTCDDVVTDMSDKCYNQTLFSQCCKTCNDHRLTVENCPFGDLEPWQCTSLSDDDCYDSYIEQNCCKSCYDRAQQREPKIDGCKYGDREVYFCSTIEDHQCYHHANRCCDTCYWLSDQSLPDCLYGNRNPDLCYNVATHDCYNKTVAVQCCGWCADLRNNQNADCLYGDKQERCNNIERRECYRSSIVDTCCDTCVQYADNNHPDCAYGDRRDCSDITVDECYSTVNNIEYECCQTCRFLTENDCLATSYDDEPFRCIDIQESDCYDPGVRNECCFTCNNYYQLNTHLGDDTCQFGDRQRNCYRRAAWECYNPKVKHNCCETCFYNAHFYKENCEFGDRTPNQCWSINNTDCYNPVTERDCCESCSYNEIDNLPTNCRYGDKNSTCSEMAPYACYAADVAETCCETCMHYDQSDDLGSACRYGDRKFDCYTEGQHICYDYNERRECCRYCQNVENPDNIGCEFGDKERSCGSISAKDCYNVESKCCATCPMMVSFYNIDGCEYGDRTNCTGITDADCYNSDTRFKCCETCWLRSNGNNNGCEFGDSASDCGNINPWDCYFREVDCCATCENLQSTVTGLSYCKYGDRSSNCDGVSADQCYNQNTQYQCCETCYDKRRNDLPDSCLYGDKISTCQNHHSSECYVEQRRDVCCESCLEIKTSNPNCEYGDKLISCDSVFEMPHLCYNNTVENRCCSSCPLLADNSRPGCEYGDLYQYCDKSRCGQYSALRLLQCCDTCWGHSDVSTTEDPVLTTTFPTTTDDKGEPGSNDKQSTTSPVTSSEPSSTTWIWWWESSIFTTEMYTATTTTTTILGNYGSHGDSGNTDSPKMSTPFSSLSSVRSSTEPSKTTLSSQNEHAVNKFIGNTLPIVGGVIGGVLVIAIVIIGACFVMRKNRNNKKPRSKYPNLTNLDGPPPSRHAPSYFENTTRNPAIGNPGYTARRENRAPQPNIGPQPNMAPLSNKAPPREQHNKHDEEVYDYIDDSDVRSLPSIKRPSVPDRGGANGEGYLEPAKNGKAEYVNPAYDNDSSKDYHTYHVLQKDGQATAEREYMQL